MKKIIFICLLLAYLPLILQAQTTDNSEIFAQTIRAEDVNRHLSVLTADSLEGRETGTVGNFKAANYIAQHFANLGLPKAVGDSSYFQKMIYTNESWDDVSLNVNETSYRHLFNFYCYPGYNTNLLSTTFNEVTFLGYGIDDERYSDYKNQDVKGKVIMIYTGEPTNAKGISQLTKDTSHSIWTTDIRQKLITAYQKGVKVVLIIDNDLAKNVQQAKNFFTRNTIGEVELPDGRFANNLYISLDIAKEIIGKQTDKFIATRKKCESGKPRPLALTCKLTLKQKKYFSQLVGNNVLGFIEGSDPVLKNEIVVVSAHYDHLGKRGESIYHGADDNGSGSSAVLEIAEAMALAKKAGQNPRRSVLCLLVTGEEKGLLGSNYYAKFPIFPLKNTVADVNIDMVGRVDEKYKNNPDYVYVIGADRLSLDLDHINTDMNNQYAKLTLDYTYNDPLDPNHYYERSDHYNFAKNGIPAIFYFNGVHEDYHRPSDTIDKINMSKIAKIAQLAFHTAWEIANRDERLKINAPQSKKP